MAVFQLLEHLFGVVGGVVVDDDDFELGVVLLEQQRKELAQVVGLVVCAEHNGERRELVGIGDAPFAALVAVREDAAVEAEVVALDDEKEQGGYGYREDIDGGENERGHIFAFRFKKISTKIGYISF